MEPDTQFQKESGRVGMEYHVAQANFKLSI